MAFNDVISHKSGHFKLVLLYIEHIRPSQIPPNYRRHTFSLTAPPVHVFVVSIVCVAGTECILYTASGWCIIKDREYRDLREQRDFVCTSVVVVFIVHSRLNKDLVVITLY